MKVKRIVTYLLIEKLGVFLTKVNPKLNTQYISLLVNHKFMNLKNPKTFPEKISWLKLYRYANNPLVKRCADKFAVREYVKENGLGYMLNDLIAVFDDTKEIKWDELPDSFVLKWNFGSGFNYLCKNKNKVNINKVVNTLNKWQEKEFWLFFAELQYNVSIKKILCERFLGTSNNSLIDYKFYCFHGSVKAILVIERINNNAERAVFMSPKWEYLSDVNYKYKDVFIPDKPASLNEMNLAAEKLSSKFPFVRVDFYEYENKPIFGEMTFTPAAGINPSETLVDGRIMGDYITLDLE